MDNEITHISKTWCLSFTTEHIQQKIQMVLLWSQGTTGMFYHIRSQNSKFFKLFMQ